jgi:hypothetical protein
LKRDAYTVSSERLDEGVVKETTMCRYRVIAPSTNLDRYPVHKLSWVGDFVPITGLADMDHRSIRVRIGGGDFRTLPAVFERKPDSPVVVYRCESFVPYSSGQIEVEMETVLYRPERYGEPYVLNRMSYLTRGAKLKVAVLGRDINTFRARLIGGIGAPTVISSPHSNVIRMDYPDWLLEDHGYFISWDEVSTAGSSRSVSRGA